MGGCNAKNSEVVDAMRAEAMAQRRASAASASSLTVTGDWAWPTTPPGDGGELGKLGGGAASAKGGLPPDLKSEFLTKVFLALALQVVLACAIGAGFGSQAWLSQRAWLFYVTLLVLLGALIWSSLFGRAILANPPLHLVAFFSLSFLSGLVLATSGAALSLPVLGLSAGALSAMYGGLVAFASAAGSDFSGQTPYLFVGCWGVAVLGLELIFAGDDPESSLLGGLVALALSLHAVKETKRIVVDPSLSVVFGSHDIIYTTLAVYMGLVTSVVRAAGMNRRSRETV